MTDSTAKPFKIVLRTIGVINIVLSLLGTLSLVLAVFQFFTTKRVDPSTPYFRLAFIAMTNMNIVFLGILLLTAIRFLQTRASAINLYSIAALALLLYDVAIASLWMMGGHVAMSVAAATAVGNRGTAFFRFALLVPYLYPLISIVLLQVFKRLYRTQQDAVST